MTFVVTESCIQCKYTDCVAVCPVDCFHEGPNFLVINPETCVDCGICVAECPVEAIFADVDLPEGQQAFLAINAELAQNPAWPVIKATKPPLAEHERWKQVEDKRELLIRVPG